MHESRQSAASERGNRTPRGAKDVPVGRQPVAACITDPASGAQ
jgi:hypothetical protein